MCIGLKGEEPNKVRVGSISQLTQAVALTLNSCVVGKLLDEGLKNHV